MTVISFLEFRSRVDRWMAWTILGSCVLLLGSCLLALVDDSSTSFGTGLIVLTTIITCPMMLWILFGTRYRLTETHLFINSGPLKNSIKLNKIESIEPTRSYLSSPSLSSDRFLIRYNKFATVMISPEDRGVFLQEMAARAPHLIWQDEKLVTLS